MEIRDKHMMLNTVRLQKPQSYTAQLQYGIPYQRDVDRLYYMYIEESYFKNMKMFKFIQPS